MASSGRYPLISSIEATRNDKGPLRPASEQRTDLAGHRGTVARKGKRSPAETWTIPYTAPPCEFAKADLTDEEIEVELARSPLYDRLRAKRYAPLRRPPLPLNKGHTSMLLLTGLLDGYVPSDPPHVVRAHCGKDERLVRAESHVTPNGTQVDKRVYSEQPRPVVRAVWADGVIRTFAEGTRPADLPTPKEEDIVIEDEGDALEDDDE